MLETESLIKTGRALEALEVLIRTSRDRPADADVWNHLGLTYSHLGQYPAADAAFHKARILAPFSTEVIANQGANLNAAHSHRQAIAVLKHGLQINPHCRACQLNLALALADVHQTDEALQLVQQIQASVTLNEQELSTLIAVLQRCQKQDAAESVLAQLLSLNPQHSQGLVIKASMQLDRGLFKAARRSLEPLLASSSPSWESLSLYANTHRFDPRNPSDKAWHAHVTRSLQQIQLPPRYRASLLFAQAKALNDELRYGEAFASADQANQLAASLEPLYETQTHAALVTAILDRHPIEVRVHGGHPSEQPCFIVGMPRSGTSLLEQMLASHSEVGGAGELQTWPTLVEQRRHLLIGTEEPCPDELNDCATLALAALRQCFSNKPARVIDKLPSNFLFLGLIHQVFPNARILHIRRNPVDTCLSIFFQNFGALHTYSHNFDDLAHYYRQYRRLMAHWRQVLPSDRLIEIRYEDLITEPEREVRRALAHLGLAWEPACLDFQNTHRSVGTASNWQVRQGLYTSSVERWRRYEAHVGPLLPLLKEERQDGEA